MSLPGLSLSAPIEQPVEEKPPRTVTLSPGSEWRFEVSFSATLTVKLLPSPPASAPHGTAEIFGTELATNKIYTFGGGTKAAVYTWHGCDLEITGTSESEYQSDETRMNEHVNLHFALENMRNTAAAAGTEGPRVLVIGAEDAGKTTLIKTLVAYATRTGRFPLTVNLDPSEGHLTVPGTLSTCVHGSGSLLDVEDEFGGWGSSAISGPTAVPVKMPLVYEYGLASPDDNPALFKAIATKVALAATSRFQEDPAVKTTGCFIDTPYSLTQTKPGADIIHHIVSEFSINLILVVSAERTYSDLARRYTAAPSSPGTEPVSVLKVARSGGAVDRDKRYMRALQHAQVRNYFYGSARARLDPAARTLDFADLAVFRLVDPDDSSAQFLPGGGLDDAAGRPAELYERLGPAPPPALEKALLAISAADPGESHEGIRDASVLGFLYVADVDEAAKKVRVLAPTGGRIPAKALIWANWPEGIGDLVA